jgi:hypothetical protein
MKHYKAPNKTLIKRNANGKFAKWSIEDLGFKGNDERQWCRNCHHAWMPLIKEGICPECGGQDKLTKKECIDLAYVKLTELKVTSYMIDPRILNEFRSGQKYEANIVENEVVVEKFNFKLRPVEYSFEDLFKHRTPTNKGVVYLRDRWFWFEPVDDLTAKEVDEQFDNGEALTDFFTEKLDSEQKPKPKKKKLHTTNND